MKVGPYQSELPDFLLQVIDQIIKIDYCHVLCYDSLKQPLEITLQEQIDHPVSVWLFIDPQGHKHLLSQAPHALFAPNLNQSLEHPITEKPKLILNCSNLTCTNVLSQHISAETIQALKTLQIISIDQVRLQCEANIHTDPTVLEASIRKIICWNQVFRANSLKEFQYLSVLYQKIVALLAKKDFFRKFYDIKQKDLQRLMREEIQFKVQPKTWPFVPTTFREYEQIEEYVPTPERRTPIINERMLSLKQPVECGPDCVCLSNTFPEGQHFCQFNLIHGWETRCPNRARKIECAHQSQQDQLKCRNSQIKKHQRKKCEGKGRTQGESQIQQRIAWGIDLYTRNIIFHCLPEWEIKGVKEKESNDEQKNEFIERTLAKAFNLLGSDGYNLVQACNYIKKYSQYKAPQVPIEKEIRISQEKLQPQIRQEHPQNLINQQSALKKQSIQQKSNPQSISEQHKDNVKIEWSSQNKQWLFTAKDWEYADLLLRNYELADDKSAFRVHTKGKGAICIDKKGIEQGTFIVQYFGEIYQPWRWFDREDFIKEIMKKKKFKNYMPEFYNIALQKHPDQPLGCDMLMVDPSRKGNFSSRFSHSCDPNCGTIITVSNGRYYIGMYSFKNIVFGEELTFDYCSMTESNYEHQNSICLCGMRRCRGYYLQLSNTKMFSNLMDNKNCFFTRNSAILKASEDIKEEDYQICAKSNIKEGFLRGAPNWLIKWIAGVLKFIEEESHVYKQSLVTSWKKNYPWQNAQSEEEKQQNIEKYSVTTCQELESIRLQNLLTSVDKIKYFLSKNEENQQPPIFIESLPKILEVLILNEDSVLLDLQQSLIRYRMEDLARTIQFFLGKIKNTEDGRVKLSLFRLCCLIINHRLLQIDEANFNHGLLSDIVYFYAFTHTYFSATEYKSFQAQQITISVSEILGERGHPNERREKSKKKYSSPFLWGQMASWFKQTIVYPEASLSQDRRGTLSYPLIRSIMRSQYPYEKQSRSHFLKIIQEKPANSWPPASGCDLSYKNPYKLYGTLLFENVHSKERLAGLLPKGTLLQSCLSVINEPLRQKLELFKIVENILGGLPTNHQIYEFAIHGGDPDARIPSKSASPRFTNGQPQKKVKRSSEESI